MTVTNHERRSSLGESLVKMQVITEEQLREALELQHQSGKKLTEILLNRNMVQAGELASIPSIIWKVPLKDLKSHAIQPEALDLIPEELARKHSLIPLNIIGDSLLVVMADPDDYIAISDIFTKTNMTVEVAFASAADIERAIEVYYRSNDEIQKKIEKAAPSTRKERESYAGFDIETPITESLDLIIQQAVRDRASDIHLEPQGDRLRVRYRIDGILYNMNSLPIDVHAELASRIKILAEMDVTRSRQPQDGQFSLNTGGRMIDIRVATTDTVHGERITLRLLDKSLSLFTLSELGMLPETMMRYKYLLKYPLGMVLAGGPTGSGKTTTLYTSINELDHDKRNIMTVEDPVEYQFVNISQCQVDVKTGVTFAGGLRAMLRQDPV